MIEAKYVISFRAEIKTETYAFIHSYKFKIEEVTELGSTPVNSDVITISCNRDYKNEELSDALDLFQVLRRRTGIVDVTPTLHTKKSRKHFVTIPISSLATFAVVAVAATNLNTGWTPFEVFVGSGLPALVTGGLQVLYRVAKWELSS